MSATPWLALLAILPALPPLPAINGRADGQVAIPTAYLLVDGYRGLTAEECQRLAATLAQAATIVQLATDATLAHLPTGRTA